jgi:hypothetical protein
MCPRLLGAVAVKQYRRTHHRGIEKRRTRDDLSTEPIGGGSLFPILCASARIESKTPWIARPDLTEAIEAQLLTR